LPSQIQQEGFGHRDLSLNASFTDLHHLAEQSCLRRLGMTPFGTAGKIAAFALLEAGCPRRLSVSDLLVVRIVR
jgi:hypothetical protein